MKKSKCFMCGYLAPHIVDVVIKDEKLAQKFLSKKLSLCHNHLSNIQFYFIPSEEIKKRKNKKISKRGKL